ncbi:hypothetical protein EV368DRAFT_32078 [Lentinula lateritia]|uniref:Uncharacterized protein n=1 Tax=Lentinula aff. lateritia TaxID=2804960 RepID=A0ACC1UCG2_9AGAR|nr:hypothetical protein F5876DRAFT_32394 [Lentinula aff. lateritia]KAJ3856627.1 hypothetical protein EV368DRAFT_32078 [Lentinula lateritia]
MANERRRSWRLSISSSNGTECQESDGQHDAEISTSPSITSSHKRRWSLTPNFSKNLPLNSIDGPSDHALERISSSQPSITKEGSRTGSFGKSLSSMMGGIPGLSNLTLSRTSTKDSVMNNEDARGRSMSKNKHYRSSSHVPSTTETTSKSHSRARSQSPFSFRRFRSQRDSSPVPPLPLSSTSSEVSLVPDTNPSPNIRPRTAFTDDADVLDYGSGDDTETVNGETDGEYTEDEDSGDEIDIFDDVTERNTERNAVVELPAAGALGLFDADADIDPDPLGEGVNVVVPPEPYFPSTIHSLPSRTPSGTKRNPRRRKSTKHHEPLPLNTSRPLFQRDRCTITMIQGDPESKTATTGRKKKKYIVASDLSEESRYAVEWGIGTVLRDGDEMLVVTIVENENRVDPPIPNTADRANKLRSQQERQGLAYILIRQATSLLQRTKLNVTIACQAWHAKNARHMLLDIVDHMEPTMLIVGSRGLGQLKGILLGSTSHYLIQKCSVPVMVARRRLKRPPRKSAHLATHRVHVSLADAGIDRVAAKVDEDVKQMRDQIQRDDAQRSGTVHKDPGAEAALEREAREERIDEDGDEGDEEVDDEAAGVKVAGTASVQQ